MVYTYFSDSLPVEAPDYVLQGIWIHDPDDAADTLTHLLYSPTQRSSSYTVSSTPLEIVNRPYPVFDYGIHREDEHQFNSVIPHGPTYQSDVARVIQLHDRATLLFVKDNRGRTVFGNMQNFDLDDTKYGTSMNFAMRRAYRQEVTV